MPVHWIASNTEVGTSQTKKQEEKTLKGEDLAQREVWVCKGWSFKGLAFQILVKSTHKKVFVCVFCSVENTDLFGI